VPDDRIVHLHAAAGSDDLPDVLARPKLGRSTALADALTGAIDRAAVPTADLDFVDVYSCFPVVPKLAGLALGLPREAVLSITGGHSSFGGPLNSYSLHSLARAYERLRGTDRKGLVHANGGFLSYQHAIVLGGRPTGYQSGPVRTRTDGLEVAEAHDLDGTDVVVETATVEYDRSATPRQAFVVVGTENGVRAAVATPRGDAGAAAEWSLTNRPSQVGRRARVRVTDLFPRLERLD
jgi:acetyl-CoA C-acetyltransferase